MLGEDGRHVTLGRHTDPTAAEIELAGDGLRAAGLGGWLAVMKGVYYRSGGCVSLMMVRELAPCRASWDEAISAFNNLRNAALKTPSSPAPGPSASKHQISAKSSTAAPRGSVANPVAVVREWVRLRDKWAMSDFKGCHFEREIVLWGVRWYCRYG